MKLRRAPLKGDPDPSRPDPSRPDPSRPDPSRPDPSRPDPSRPDPSRPDPGRPDSAQGTSARGTSAQGAGAVAQGAAAQGAAGQDVVLRPRRTAIAAALGAAVLLAVFVVSAVVLRTSATGVFFRPADQIGMVVIGALLAGGVLLLARPRVRADPRGIEVRNVMVTRRLPWEVVERVAFPDSAHWARLELIGDDYLPVLAIQAVDGQRAVDGIRRVRALHGAARRAETTEG